MDALIFGGVGGVLERLAAAQSLGIVAAAQLVGQEFVKELAVLGRLDGLFQRGGQGLEAETGGFARDEEVAVDRGTQRLRR